MSLWNAVCSVLLCKSVRERTHPLYEMTHKQFAGEFFLSQSAQSSRRFLAHISSHRRASGIQSSQSVTANVGTNKGQQVAYILLIGVSRWSLPFFGEGTGEGPLSSMSLCVLFFCVILWEKEMSSVRKRNVLVGKGTVLCEGRDANQIDRNCQDISAATLLFFNDTPFSVEEDAFNNREYALLAPRRTVLQAWRACS